LLVVAVESYQLGSGREQTMDTVVAENVLTTMELKSCLDDYKKVSPA